MATKKAKPAPVTPEQVLKAIAERKILVVPIDKGNGHFYQAFFRHSNEEIGTFRSVTGINDIIGGGKTRALIGWAKKICLAKFLELVAKAEKEQGYTLLDVTPEMLGQIRANAPIPIAWLQAILKEAKNETEAILKAAGNVGTRTHNVIDGWITGNMPEVIDEDVKTPYNNFMEFVFKEDIKFICGDLAVVSAKHGFGGRLDALGIWKGELTLFDWKTANDIRDDVALQIGGYNVALFETIGLKATRGVTVRFGKDTPAEFESAECFMKHSEDTFLHALRLERNFKKKLLWRKDGEN